MILAPIIVPGLAVVLGFDTMFIRYGLSGNIIGVSLVQLVPTCRTRSSWKDPGGESSAQSGA